MVIYSIVALSKSPVIRCLFKIVFYLLIIHIFVVGLSLLFGWMETSLFMFRNGMAKKQIV